jgi:hypothetical protein
MAFEGAGADSRRKPAWGANGRVANMTRQLPYARTRHLSIALSSAVRAAGRPDGQPRQSANAWRMTGRFAAAASSRRRTGVE